MTIPTEPLIVNLDGNNLTLDEYCLFNPDGAAVDFPVLRQFMIDHTNWTKKQIGQLRGGEIKEVLEQIIAKVKDDAVPLTT